jgi:hypothetical protein
MVDDDIVSRWDETRHDMLNVMQVLMMHCGLAREALEKCGGLTDTSVGECIGHFDIAWDEAKTMHDLITRYTGLLGEMRGLAYAWRRASGQKR